MGKAWFILFLLAGGLLLTVSCENSGPAQPTPIRLADNPHLKVQAIPYPALTPIKTDTAITASAAMTDIVYVVPNGNTYHQPGCRYLFKDQIPIEREEAISRGFTPCFVCRP
jgi:hypothetical protein